MRVTKILNCIPLLLGLLALRAVSQAEAQALPRLYLQRGTLDAAAQPAAAPGPYAIVQFRGPVMPADRTALEQTGVALLEYLPDFAYLVRGTADQLGAAAGLPGVYALAPFTAADKLHPALLAALDQGETQLGQLRIVGWVGAETPAQALRDAGVDPTKALDRATLLRVAQLPDVRWIEPLPQPRLLADHARAIMGVDQAWQRSGLYGTGQILGIADSGLDTGNLSTLSPDFAGRIVASHVISAGGDLEDELGHGTHVAGLAAGAGVQSGAKPTSHQYAGSFAGVAPEAGLVIQAFEADNDGNVIGLDEDYYTLFAQAYADGARLHTNSWGDPTGPVTDTDVENDYGGYPSGARRTDQFVWEHPDMAIFFAAGNSGVDGKHGGAFGFCEGGDGIVDEDSLLTPGTAKNVITVGASEGDRSQGGLGAAPWLLVTNLCTIVAPIAADTIANNPNGMAAFSSRGPTDDGRAKPDLVAPGTNIVAARSHAPGAGTLWGEYDANYVFSGGTSMAAPLAAGAGVLARQWLVGQGLANPSAAAVKATLLNTTADMGPGQYGSGSKQEIPAARPNNVNGWGRADLGFLGAAQPYRLWVDDHSSGLTTGQPVRYGQSVQRPLEVVTNTQPLRVMLAWSDPAASLSAAKQLVNDLDLVVTGPDGTIYRGNGATDADRLNNVEGVVIQNPPLGRYSIEVRAYNVPVGAQPFALAVGGPLGLLDTPTPTVTPSASTTATPSPTTPTPTNTPTSTLPVGSPTTPAGFPTRKLYVSLALR